MIDLETLSTKSNAVILTIGAIKFNRNEEPLPLNRMDTFYRKIDIQSCMDVGLTTDKKTIEWWNKQSNEVVVEAFEGDDRIPLEEMLTQFSMWFENSNRKIWSHGDDFDCVILNNAYTACKLEPPWKFWNTRDTRTLFDIKNFNLNSIQNKQPHNALEDAYAQVLGVQLCFNTK